MAFAVSIFSDGFGIGHGVLYILDISAKGGLISGSFSLWLKSAKIVAKSQLLASSLWVNSAQGRGLAQIFRDLSQSGKKI